MVFDPDEIAQIVEESIGTSAMFAARFRECAARALLLPRRDPRRRQPLWQQRQRAAQLLDVAREFADFPVTLEAARECLQDVLDVPGLVALMREVAGRRVRVVEVETARPSPFARSLLFGYVGAFLYGDDVPLAERRAAALSLDATLLGELLGRVELRELLDPDVVVETERRLQWLDGSRTLRDAEDLVELLRVLGDLSTAECEARGARPEWLAELAASRRVVAVRIAGEPRWILVEDAGRVRDALGVALPVGLARGVPGAGGRPDRRPGGPVRAHPRAVHRGAVRGPVRARRVRGRAGAQAARGHRPGDRRRVHPGRAGRTAARALAREWCDTEVLRLLRRRSLAALRREIEPVPPARAGRVPAPLAAGGRVRRAAPRRSPPRWSSCRASPSRPRPGNGWCCPARVADYTPAYLDELCASGEMVWAGAGLDPRW